MLTGCDFLATASYSDEVFQVISVKASEERGIGTLPQHPITIKLISTHYSLTPIRLLTQGHPPPEFVRRG